MTFHPELIQTFFCYNSSPNFREQIRRTQEKLIDVYTDDLQGEVDQLRMIAFGLAQPEGSPGRLVADAMAKELEQHYPGAIGNEAKA